MNQSNFLPPSRSAVIVSLRYRERELIEGCENMWRLITPTVVKVQMTAESTRKTGRD